MHKGVIFDLDGVIVQTELIHFEAWKKTFAEVGIDLTLDEYFIKVDGKDRLSGVKSILGDVDKATLEITSKRKNDYFLGLLDIHEIKAYQDAIEFILDLKKKKIPIGLASSSKNAPLIIQRSKLEKFFDIIVISVNTIRSKPYPDIFLLTADKMNLEPENIIVFEDSIAGINAAKNAGMVCVGVKRYAQKNVNDANIIINNFRNISTDSIL